MGNFSGLQLCETCERTMIDAGVLGLIFEETIELKTELNFGQAIEALKEGKKVKRKIWGGHWQLFKNPLCEQKNADGYNTSFEFQNGLILATLKDNGGCAPAQAYQEDILAEDWEVIE